MEAGWIQVDSGGFRWIRRVSMKKILPVAEVFAYEGGGFSATTSPPYNIRRVYEALRGPRGALDFSTKRFIQESVLSRILRDPIHVHKLVEVSSSEFVGRVPFKYLISYLSRAL